MRRRAHKLPLQLIPDEAILRLARALARQAAREDHERDQAQHSEHSIKKVAVIYARFSTDLQNERSIEDQITLCRELRLARGHKHHRSV